METTSRCSGLNDNAKNKIKFNISTDGIIRPSSNTSLCLTDKGYKSSSKVLPVWGTNNCLRFSAYSTGNIRSKGGDYNNLCLLPLGEDGNWNNEYSIVLKTCNNNKIVFSDSV
jgi:hypothetical protein